MVRREGPPLYGTRYCGDRANKKLHDLDNEKAECQIDEFIATENALPFRLTKDARQMGYELCDHCFVGSM